MDRMTRTAKTPATPSTVETRSPPETPEKLTPRERTGCHRIFGLGLGFKTVQHGERAVIVVPIVHCLAMVTEVVIEEKRIFLERCARCKLLT